MTVGKFVGSLVLGRRFPYPKPRRKNGLVFGQSITCHVFDSLQWVEAHEFSLITCMEFLGTRDHLLPIAWGGGGGKGGWGGIHEPHPLLLLVSHPPQKANVTISFLSPYPPIPLYPYPHIPIGWKFTTVLLSRFMNLHFVVNEADSNDISLKTVNTMAVRHKNKRYVK